MKLKLSCIKCNFSASNFTVEGCEWFYCLKSMIFRFCAFVKRLNCKSVKLCLYEVLILLNNLWIG